MGAEGLPELVIIKRGRFLFLLVMIWKIPQTLPRCHKRPYLNHLFEILFLFPLMSFVFGRAT